MNRKQKRASVHRQKDRAKRVATIIKNSPALLTLEFRPSAYLMTWIFSPTLTLGDLEERFRSQVQTLFEREEARLIRAGTIPRG